MALPWTPGVAYYDASGQSAGSLAPWSDSSGNGNNAAAIGGVTAPTVTANLLNGLPGVVFGGSEALQLPFSAVSQPWTVIAVFKGPTSGIGFFTGDSSVEIGVNAGKPTLYAGSANITGTTVISTAQTCTFQGNGSSSLVRQNGTQVASGNPGANAYGGSSAILGGQAYQTGSVYRPFTGTLFAVVIDNTARSTADVEAMEAALYDIWFTTTLAGGASVVYGYSASAARTLWLPASADLQAQYTADGTASLISPPPAITLPTSVTIEPTVTSALLDAPVTNARIDQNPTSVTIEPTVTSALLDAPVTNARIDTADLGG